MTPREIQKTIEFLLRHQAVAEVRQDRTDAQIARLVAQNRVMARQVTESDRRLDEPEG